MKRIILTLAFLILTACSQTEAAPTAANTPVPPTATVEPTATNTPEPTLTPTPTEIPITAWQGEEGEWIISELDQEENRVRIEQVSGQTAVVWEEDGVEYFELIENEQGVENIRLLKHEFKWPVIVGDKNGEMLARDTLTEAFLPMPENYSELYAVSERAIQMLVEMGKLPSLEELKETLDWDLVAANGGHVGERIYGELGDEHGFVVTRELNTFVGGYFRLYVVRAENRTQQ